jgi:RAB protein geranylgeranyltransferase component A
MSASILTIICTKPKKKVYKEISQKDLQSDTVHTEVANVMLYSDIDKILEKRQTGNGLLYVGMDTDEVLVGRFMIKDFNSEGTSHILLTQAILYKFLEFIKVWEKQGYSQQDFKVIDGYRSKEFNKNEGGAPASQHIIGNAIDLDFKTEPLKAKAIKIFEELLSYTGGIGYYPGSTVLHFDVRSKMARWNSY